MKVSKKQQILIYLTSVKEANISEIYKNVSFNYYCNANKHLGAVLSNLVKTRKIERVKNGVFKIKKKVFIANSYTESLF